MFLHVALLLLLLAVAAATVAMGKSFHATARETCERDVCQASHAPDEHGNCIAKCISPKCFDKIYRAAPLENGEVDDKRKGQFSACVAQEERTERNWAKQKQWNGHDHVSAQEIARKDSDW